MARNFNFHFVVGPAGKSHFAKITKFSWSIPIIGTNSLAFCFAGVARFVRAENAADKRYLVSDAGGVRPRHFCIRRSYARLSARAPLVGVAASLSAKPR